MPKNFQRFPKLVGKATEALPVTVGFVAENALALIVFVAGLVGGMVDAKSKAVYTRFS